MGMNRVRCSDCFLSFLVGEESLYSKLASGVTNAMGESWGTRDGDDPDARLYESFDVADVMAVWW